MLTLIEAAKLETGDVVRSAVIELYAKSSPILEVLPFDDIPGNALKYNREDKLPGVGFRGVNEGYSESTGVLNPQVETLAIAGGDLDVDKFIVDTMGQGQRSTQEAMKIKAMSLRWTKAFIKGDSESNPREFDGMQRRIVGTQLIDNSGGTGSALSLAKLDELLDQVNGANALVMNKTMRRLLTAAARNPAVSGYITYGQDAFGRRLAYYNDVPILVLDEDESGNQILPFNEAAGGGGTTNTSIYALAFGADALQGIQNGGIDARDIGELESKPAYRTRVEWYSGIAQWHGKAAARLRGISNAAVTV